MCCKMYVSRLLQDTLTGLKHPQTVSIFIMYITVKMATIVGVINRFIPSRYVQPACRISLGSKFTGLDSGVAEGVGRPPKASSVIFWACYFYIMLGY